MAASQPLPGRPIARGGKPYLWVTWLTKVLGGDQCLFAPWFKAHFKYAKYELETEKLQEWNRDHTALMREVRTELEENGWHVCGESENDFRLEGAVAIVAGKPDIIATMPGHVLVVDGKTGQPRESDWWQIAIYLFAIGKTCRDLTGELLGEVRYRSGRGITVRTEDITQPRVDEFVRVVKVVAGPTPPAPSPSRQECRRCNIGPADCSARVQEGQEAAATAMVGEF